MQNEYNFGTTKWECPHWSQEITGYTFKCLKSSDLNNNNGNS